MGITEMGAGPRIIGFGKKCEFAEDEIQLFGGVGGIERPAELGGDESVLFVEQFSTINDKLLLVSFVG